MKKMKNTIISAAIILLIAIPLVIINPHLWAIFEKIGRSIGIAFNVAIPIWIAIGILKEVLFKSGD